MKSSSFNLFALLFFMAINVFSFSNLKAQIVRCGTPSPTLEQAQTVRDYINHQISLGKTLGGNQQTIPVATHMVRYDDGTDDITDDVVAQ